MKVILLVCVAAAAVFLLTSGANWSFLLAGLILVACPLAMLGMHRMSDDMTDDLHHGSEAQRAQSRTSKDA